MTKTNLTDPDWAAEFWIRSAVGTLDPVQLARNGRDKLFIWACSSRLSVDTNATPLQLAQLIVGTCVTISNATYTGADIARGTFTNGTSCNLPINSGVILCSGDITNAIGPNDLPNATTANWADRDVDLDKLTGGGPTTNAAILEFDIVSSNSFVLQFQYIFASEEYPEWIGHYNDPMAIFVSTNYTGTNWINTNNIALVPGTNLPVRINTICGGGTNLDGIYFPPSYPQYYVDNGDPEFSTNAPVCNIQYDGMTVLLTAQTSIPAGVPHHIKIAIAD